MNNHKIITVNRDNNVDILRGFAILLVIIGHLNTPFTTFIFSFHMPLFFLISGFFQSKELSIHSIFKNFRKTIIPYIILAF